MLVARRPVTRTYETTVIGDHDPFQTIVETTSGRSGRGSVRVRT